MYSFFKIFIEARESMGLKPFDLSKVDDALLEKIREDADWTGGPYEIELADLFPPFTVECPYTDSFDASKERPEKYIERTAKIIRVWWDLVHENDGLWPEEEEFYSRLASKSGKSGHPCKQDDDIPVEHPYESDDLFDIYRKDKMDSMRQAYIYLRYVYLYDVRDNKYISLEESTVCSNALEEEMLAAMVSGQAGGRGFWNVRVDPERCFVVRSTDYIWGKARFGAGKWRITFDSENRLDKMNTEVLESLVSALEKMKHEFGHLFSTWLWAIECPSMIYPSHDFHRHYTRYWENRLSLDFMNKEEAVAKKRGYSTQKTENMVACREFRFHREIITPGALIARMAFDSGASAAGFEEHDIYLIAAWVKAAIHTYPSIKQALESEYGPGNTEWLCELPSRIADVISSVNSLEAMQVFYKLPRIIFNGLRRELRSAVLLTRNEHKVAILPETDLKSVPTARPNSIQPTEDFADPVNPIEEFHAKQAAREQLAWLLPLLTEQEQKILKMRAEELSFDDIAEALGISDKTVYDYWRRICARANGQRPPSREWRKAHNLPQRQKRTA